MKHIHWLFALFLLALPAPASAHPHVWVTYWVKPISTPAGISKIHFVWKFDAMFTDLVKEEFKLKDITEKDSDLLRDKAFGNLKNYHYYMYMTVDGTKFLPEEISNFKAHMQGKSVVYDFDIALPKPAKTFDLVTYDDEFYVDLGPPVEEVPNDKKGGSFMSQREFKAKDFLSTGAENGAKPPVCTNTQEQRNNETWGKFTTFTVTCKAAP